MPLQSYRGPLPPLDAGQATLSAGLREDVIALAQRIGERNVFIPTKLHEAADYIQAALQRAGYQPRRQWFQVMRTDCANLEVELPGTSQPEQIVVVGAHYDSVSGSPGANDNGSGVAALLALARAWVGRKPARTVRFVAFVNEEPPFFQTDQMGSLVYARACRQQHQQVVAMLSLETIGYFNTAKGSQQYPFPVGLFYPSQGDFIGFVGNTANAKLVRRCVASFRRHAAFPSEGGALPASLPGIGWSDHWAFWQVGYPALMVTDTAPFRYRFYHTPEDTPDKLDYDRLARVVTGLDKVIEDQANH
jgi:Zn-dependent M28 family amino/carboxypeptidase